jgi:2,4-dienoyl-CoA reductase (NADPH2)
MKEVKMMADVSYEKIDDKGLHIKVGEEQQILDVDHVIICAGQVSLKELEAGLSAAGQNVHLIGGANIAAQLDAKMAIKEASELAVKL